MIRSSLAEDIANLGRYWSCKYMGKVKVSALTLRCIRNLIIYCMPWSKALCSTNTWLAIAFSSPLHSVQLGLWWWAF